MIRRGQFAWSCGSTPTTRPAPGPNGGVRSLPWRDAALLPARTPSSAAPAATIRFTNQRRAPIAIDRIDLPASLGGVVGVVGNASGRVDVR